MYLPGQHLLGVTGTETNPLVQVGTANCPPLNQPVRPQGCDVLGCIGLSHVTTPGPGTDSASHRPHGQSWGGVDPQVNQKKEGAQVSLRSLQNSRGAVTLSFINSSCRSGGRPLPAPEMPTWLFSPHESSGPREAMPEMGCMDGPHRHCVGRRTGCLSLTSPALPHRTLGCLSISITGHPGLFSEGRLLSPPAWRRDTAPSLLTNGTQCNELFKGKLVRLRTGFLIWEEEKG